MVRSGWRWGSRRLRRSRALRSMGGSLGGLFLDEMEVVVPWFELRALSSHTTRRPATDVRRGGRARRRTRPQVEQHRHMGGHRGHRSIALRSSFFRCPARVPARGCRRHEALLPRAHECAPLRPGVRAARLKRRPAGESRAVEIDTIAGADLGLPVERLSSV